MRGQRPRIPRVTLVAVGAVVVAACAGEPAADTADGPPADTGTSATTADRPAGGTETSADTADELRDVGGAAGPRFTYPAAPPAPAAEDVNAEAAALIDSVNAGLGEQRFEFLAVADLGAAGDPRHAWYVTDLMRFFGDAEGDALRNAFEQLTGASLAEDPASADSPWRSAVNHLIAWDTPAYPGYREDKAVPYLVIEPRWAPFFEDVDADIDWRYVSWGGVLIDDRELGDPEPCATGCIPALDDPAVTPAALGDWYPDERIVFGMVEGREALAIPLNIAEVHEMFNLTLGGRRLAIPYCTLCGSAQAYYVDDTGAAEEPVLRTSGLLSRSNKVMYDLRTSSVFDTFTGDAVSGPLQDAGVMLEETTVVRSTWAEWRAEHPDTMIVAEDGGIGRGYPLDPLAGRDDDGPIFPIGDVDPRLPVQELVVGVTRADGSALAFPSEAASATLAAGGDVVLDGVRLEAAGDGLVAVDGSGAPLAAHEAFWFAWSQFHPDTSLWTP